MRPSLLPRIAAAMLALPLFTTPAGAQSLTAVSLGTISVPIAIANVDAATYGGDFGTSLKVTCEIYQIGAEVPLASGTTTVTPTITPATPTVRSTIGYSGTADVKMTSTNAAGSLVAAFETANKIEAGNQADAVRALRYINGGTTEYACFLGKGIGPTGRPLAATTCPYTLTPQAQGEKVTPKPCTWNTGRVKIPKS